jgi:hypothetical protein
VHLICFAGYYIARAGRHALACLVALFIHVHERGIDKNDSRFISETKTAQGKTSSRILPVKVFPAGIMLL